MISRATIQRILDTAVYAPSGDNAQPWRFVCSQNTISIYNIPDRDATLYNFRQRGSYVGHGALIENIVITAGHEGLDSSVAYFPGPALCVAKIELTPGTVQNQSLYEAIRLRSCNRKPYDMQPLGPRDLALIQDSVGHSSVSLALVEDRQEILRLAEAVATNELVLMQHRGLHDFLFGMIRWSRSQEERQPGLYIKTMEFPAPVQILMKYVISHWSLLTFLNIIGLSKAIAKQSGAVYNASSVIGALIIESDADQAYIEAGRALQRVWLTATSSGLAMQPITAIPYLRDRIQAGESEMFSEEHRTLIRNAYAVFVRAFSVRRDEQHIAMIFRLGRAAAPTAMSHKLPPVIEYKDLT